MVDRLNLNKPLDEERYGSGKLALRADQLDGANATVLTVTNVEEVSINDPDAPSGTRYALTLQSKEYPDRGFFLNKTGRREVVERYGNVPARWVGKSVPLIVVRVRNPKTDTEVDSLQVAVGEEWDEAMEQFTGASRSRARGTRTAAKKATRAKKTRKR